MGSEMCIRDRPYLEPIKGTLDRMREVMVGAETDLAITKYDTPCGFFDKDVFMRCRIDFVAANKDFTEIIAFDYKTGKKSDAQIQHDVIKRCLKAAYPQAQFITTVFWYLTKGVVDIQEYDTTDELMDLDFKVNKVLQAQQTDTFPYEPNGLCKRWCDVFSCPHNGRSNEM